MRALGAESWAVGLTLQPPSFLPPLPPLQDSWLHFHTGGWGRVLGLEMRVSGGKGGLTGSFGPAPAFSQARELYSNFTKRTIKRARTLSMDPCRPRTKWARRGSGSGMVVTVTSGHFQEVPLLLSPCSCLRWFVLKRLPSKPEKVLSVGSFSLSLTYDWFRHTLQKKRKNSWQMCTCVCVCVQSCPTLCDPTDCSPPGSSVLGIPQARILEWVATPSSWGSFWPRIELGSSALQADS